MSTVNQFVESLSSDNCLTNERLGKQSLDNAIREVVRIAEDDPVKVFDAFVVPAQRKGAALVIKDHASVVELVADAARKLARAAAENGSTTTVTYSDLAERVVRSAQRLAEELVSADGIGIGQKESMLAKFYHIVGYFPRAPRDSSTTRKPRIYRYGNADALDAAIAAFWSAVANEQG